MLATVRIFWLMALTLLISVAVSACSLLHSDSGTGEHRQNKSLSNEVQLANLTDILPDLAQYRVVLVGESHNRLDHHVIQLDIIKYLHSVNPSLAIGLEFFQQPFQSILNDYVESRIDEQAMLEQTEYFSRWRFDYRLYAPILRFARENRIPLIALNIPAEVSSKAARKGIGGLTKEEKKYVPDEIDRSLPGYEQRILESFNLHQEEELVNPDFFLEAQLLWDEGMASRAAGYLQNNPAQQMVILAGSGHVIGRTGIPARLERRIHSPVGTVMLLNSAREADTTWADYLVKTSAMDLPKKGLLGILLDTDERGVFAASFTEKSAANEAGLEENDYIRSVDGRKIESFTDISLVMWNKSPGESVALVVERADSDILKSKEFTVTLN